MTKLSDAQLILLSKAAQRENGSIYPLPETLAPARVTKAVAGMNKASLIEEREVTEGALVHRTHGDDRYGLFITAVGLQAIGVEVEEDVPASQEAAAHTAPRQTKTALVLGLLQADGGASVAQLIAATGWLPHTTRAALTGLRKRGHAIERSRREGETVYRIVAA